MTTASSRLQEDVQSRAFVLEVSGLDVRYYGGSGDVAPPSKEYDADNSLEYTDVAAVIGVGRSDNRISGLGGLAEHSPIRIKLATYGADASGNDPGIIFGRLGIRCASSRALLITTVEQDDDGPATVEVDRDLSALAFPRVIHIGGESMRTTGFAGDGTAGDRYRFTGITRGYLNSRIQRHDADADTGNQPHVTTPEVVNWRGRRATLYAANNPSGSGTFASEYVEVMRGFFESSPQVDSDGLSISLDLVPITAALDQALAAPKASSTVKLLSGFHYFTDQAAHVVTHTQHLASRAGRVLTTVGAAAAVNDGDIQVASTDGHENAFDVTLDSGHPRAGTCGRAGRMFHPTGYLTAPTRFDLDADEPSAAYSLDEPVVLLEVGELHQADVLDGAASGCLKWPEDAITEVNSAWAPGTKDGAAGSWLDVAITADKTIEATSNCTDLGDFPAVVEVYNGRHEMALDWSASPPSFGPSPRKRLTYGLDLRDPEVERRRNPRHTGRRISLHPRDQDGWLARTQIVGWPFGFYQRGEEYILVDGDPGNIPAGGLTMLARFWDPNTGEESSHPFKVGSATSTSYNGQVVGYRLALSDPTDISLRSFGNWSGEMVAELSPVVSFIDARPGEMLLHILLSGGGGDINHATYDTLPTGANMAAADVDIDSFERIVAAPGFDAWSLTIEDGATVREVVDMVGRALGYGFAMRRNDEGECRLTAFPVGPENRTEAVATITAGEWAASPAPGYGDDDEIVNRLEVEANFPMFGEDAEITVSIVDQASVNAHFGETVTEEIVLRGVEVPTDNDARIRTVLRPWYASLFAWSAYPRRLWAGRTGTGRAWLGELGAVYTVSSPHFRGFSDSLGVVALQARVTEIGIELWDEGADLVLSHSGVNGAGWNAAAQVASVDNATTVTLSANVFSAATHPVTGATQADVDAFAAGMTVRCVPAGAHDSAVTRDIDSITGNQVVFTAAHGLSVGDNIEPDTYDNASASLQVYGYLADAAETLGAGADDGQEYT